MRIELVEELAYDAQVVQAARVSLNAEVRLSGGPLLHAGDDKLIEFLLSKRHGTPFEHSFFKFRVEAPIFVFREWHRHRVGHSYNEMSGRYTELEEKFYWPKEWRTQVGRPGRYTYEPIPNDSTEAVQARDDLTAAYKVCWDTYQRQLERGIAKEQARIVLPVGIYSKMYWSCNARSLMHFLGLRNKPDAQQEIRELAAQAQLVFEELMPVTAAAFEANGRVAP